MFLTEILKNLNSNNTNLKISIANSAIFYTKIILKPNTQYISLGVSFSTKTKSFDLFYNCDKEIVIKQPQITHYKKILGRVFFPDETCSYIGHPTNGYIGEYASDNSKCYLDKLKNNYDFEEFDKTKSVVCQGVNKENIEITNFRIFDFNDESLTISLYPLTFKNFKVFYNKEIDEYEKFIDDNEFYKSLSRENQSIKNGEDEINSWDEENFWKAGRDGAD